MDLAKVTVWVRDQAALKQLLSTGDFSLDCGRPRQELDGSFRVTLYAPKTQARKIAKSGLRVEIDESYGDVLEQRQLEVSREDRFEGGTIKPEGLGIKR